MQETILVAWISSFIGFIVLLFIAKAIFGFSKLDDIDHRLRIQNQLLALMAEKAGVDVEDIKKAISGQLQAK